MKKLHRILFTDWNIHDLDKKSIWETIYNKLHDDIQSTSDEANLWEILVNAYGNISNKYFLDNFQIFQNWIQNHPDEILSEFTIILHSTTTTDNDIAKFIEELPTYESFKEFIKNFKKHSVKSQQTMSVAEGLMKFISTIKTTPIATLGIEKLIFVGGTSKDEVNMNVEYLLNKNFKFLNDFYIKDANNIVHQFKILYYNE